MMQLTQESKDKLLMNKIFVIKLKFVDGKTFVPALLLQHHLQTQQLQLLLLLQQPLQLLQPLRQLLQQQLPPQQQLQLCLQLLLL